MTKQQCPFCGGRDIRSHHRGHPTSGEWVIECHDCSCELTGFASEQDAWKTWNGRWKPALSGDPSLPSSNEITISCLCGTLGCSGESCNPVTYKLAIASRENRSFRAEIDRLRAGLQWLAESADPNKLTGLFVVAHARRVLSGDSSLPLCNKPNMNTQPGGSSANSPGSQGETSPDARDAARYRYLRQGEDVLSPEDEDHYNEMWRTILPKGCDRERMDAAIDAAIAKSSPVETGPKPDAEKAPVTSAEMCPTWDQVQHKEHNGKCVYCGAPMPSQSKARTPLRDSDAAFNLGVLPTEQPEKAGVKPCPSCFGDKTISMSDGSKRSCEYCGGTGVEPSQNGSVKP